MSGRRDIAVQRERECIRALQAQERAVRAAEKERARLEREVLRQQKEDAIREGEAEATELNVELDARYSALETILETGLSRVAAVDFTLLKDRTRFPGFKAPAWLAAAPARPSIESFMPSPQSFFGKFFGKQKHEQAVVEARDSYEDACAKWDEGERLRVAELERQQIYHNDEARHHAQRLARQHAEIDDFEQRYRAGEPEPVRYYCELVLQASPYPDGCPVRFKLAYVHESRQVVVEYQLPTFDVIPEESEFRYVKSRDEITWSDAKAGVRKSLYTEVVSAIAIRTIHELFEADVALHVDVVVFNGFVCGIDPATGSDIQPHLITARATRDDMAAIDLGRVDPQACLRHLRAQVSRSPSELQPVRPIVDFNMVDSRFIEHGDILAALDKRANLMEMSPGEFETLVTNLFEKMGLETKLTQASRDGGVDCVAYDQRPILGGKVVIQAKRYKHTVGVSAVRDLFGTMHNEGANKGILVTTSDYGKAAFDFANGKPIELVNGSNLLYLLGQQGIEAKIEIPDEWQDPVVEL